MKRFLICMAVMGSSLLVGCNDDFLERKPVTGLTEENTFTSYDNFKSFMWPCYEMFLDKTLGTAITDWGMNGFYQGDMRAGYLESKYESEQNEFAYQTVPNVASGNGWDFKFIRRVNIMLSHLDNSKMTEEEKNHWKAVGYFFHSFWYMELVNRFGDIPWVDKVLDDSSPEMYGPRESRDVVAAHIMERLKWAEENIGSFKNRDGENTIDVNCVRAALSRFTLREGTWRKYHELGDADIYLNECIRVSKELMKTFPDLYYGTGVDAGQPGAGYGQLWNSEDLSGIPGIILYKEYTANVNSSGQCYIEHTSSHKVEMNQNTVDLYLMKNGKPIGNSLSNYQGNKKDMYAVFRDRDPRLYQVVMPPYKVEPNGADKPAGNLKATWGYTDNPADREYIDLLGANESCSTTEGVGMKRLPGQNWSASLVPAIPRLGTGAFVTCRSGYYVWKNWSNWENTTSGLNTADKPIFKIEEVLLNYAEAMYETGQFDQSVANETINKLRKRVGVTAMNVAEIDDSFDPNRGYYNPKGNENGIQVDPLLWEIRRERIIELMGEGFGFDDIRRWRMAPWFLNRTATGYWTTKSEALANGMTLYNTETGFSDGTNGNMQEGFLYLFNNPLKEGKGWLEKYYLYQVPTTEIVLNPKLTQNPGWD